MPKDIKAKSLLTQEPTWLNAIYNVNLRTNEFDTGFNTDLHTIAENIANNHDPNVAIKFRFNANLITMVYDVFMCECCKCCECACCAK